ncbi:PTS sugar transporter subunit IIC [Sebaldella sp. S0638]|uniref:PTS sugar transporter subunit IIC n=1 Tax=Sebaldella sp. S0638 TaxID=2957809 RepID=UPI0020A17911|nr:PTS transporter subunit EIIC [Sebaldella sp. S0638]MCP1225934.1 PTS transporter subunit EIIC [Sebaldella sp. S0638]
MEKVLERFAEKMMPVANAIGSQRHMQAVRNGLISILPLTIVGSFFVILLNIPINGYAELIAPYKEALDIPFRFTVGIMSLYSAFTIGSFLGKGYKLDDVTSGFLAMLATILMIVPVNIKEGITTTGAAVSGRYIPIAPLSSQGLFGAIVASLIAVEIYRFIKEKKIEIKMPDGVPPVVASSFAALFPTLIIIIIFWIPRHFWGFDLNGIISFVISPLKIFLTGNNLIGGVLTQFFICLFWIFGIHGHAVLGPIIRPFWDQAIIQNMELFQAGTSAFQLPNIFTEQFFQWYAQMGGTGGTLALVVLFMTSKSQYLKQLGKLSILPGIFNINEPMIFGAPIVMNPLLAVPFMLVPVVNTIIVYIFTALNIIPRMMVKPPFTLPAPLGALVTTNWNWMACVLVFICFFVSMAIYYPFFKMFEKRTLDNENVQSAEAQ